MRTHIWPILSYDDAPAAIDFLQRAFGFTVTASYPSDDDPSHLVHVEMAWPDGGGVMFSSARDGGAIERRTGIATVYVVCTDPDALFERATAAGAEVVLPVADQEDYGSREFTVRDPEGNTWSFGTYAGAAG